MVPAAVAVDAQQARAHGAIPAALVSHLVFSPAAPVLLVPALLIPTSVAALWTSAAAHLCRQRRCWSAQRRLNRLLHGAIAWRQGADRRRPARNWPTSNSVFNSPRLRLPAPTQTRTQGYTRLASIYAIMSCNATDRSTTFSREEGRFFVDRRARCATQSTSTTVFILRARMITRLSGAAADARSSAARAAGCPPHAAVS